MLGRLFWDHPRSLGMSWASHGAGAVVIGARMIVAGLACVVHALVPGLFTDTAGKTIASLNEHISRRKAGSGNPEAWSDYDI
jgi:hypothetical protein